jgi:hypothetical protein
MNAFIATALFAFAATSFVDARPSTECVGRYKMVGADNTCAGYNDRADLVQFAYDCDSDSTTFEFMRDGSLKLGGKALLANPSNDETKQAFHKVNYGQSKFYIGAGGELKISGTPLRAYEYGENIVFTDRPSVYHFQKRSDIKMMKL